MTCFGAISDDRLTGTGFQGSPCNEAHPEAAVEEGLDQQVYVYVDVANQDI